MVSNGVSGIWMFHFFLEYKSLNHLKTNFLVCPEKWAGEQSRLNVAIIDMAEIYFRCMSGGQGDLS